MVIKKTHLKIYGVVQGVGYRYSAFRKAKQLCLTGWVKNRSDGSVELYIEGPDDKIEEMVSWAKKGPPSAKVTHVDVKKEEGEPTCLTFEIRY